MCPPCCHNSGSATGTILYSACLINVIRLLPNNIIFGYSFFKAVAKMATSNFNLNIITRYTHAQMPRAECIFFVDNENVIVITSWSADAALLSAGFWPAELVLSPGLVS